MGQGPHCYNELLSQKQKHMQGWHKRARRSEGRRKKGRGGECQYGAQGWGSEFGFKTVLLPTSHLTILLACSLTPSLPPIFTSLPSSFFLSLWKMNSFLTYYNLITIPPSYIPPSSTPSPLHANPLSFWFSLEKNRLLGDNDKVS